MKNQNYVDLVNRPLPGGENSGFPSISLFSGILGIEIGLERAGFQALLALDFDPDARDVVAANRACFGSLRYFCENIEAIPPQRILDEVGLQPGEVALLAGGPPCQPFSKSGLRQGIEDERGLLFKTYLKYLTTIKPTAFLLENVRGLYSSRGGRDFQLILKDFDDTGYSVYWKVLDAANFGVPQFRQRLFLVGFKDCIKFKWPEETNCDFDELGGTFLSGNLPFRTVEEAIGDLSRKTTGPPHTGRYAHLIPEIPEGLNYSFFTAERGHPNPLFEWRSKFWYFLLKADRNRPSLTIQAYPGNNTGPFHWENRKLSIEELRRIQSLPDWLTIDKPYLTAHRLIGNAVPPLLSEAIGNSIIDALRLKERISKTEYLRIRAISERKATSVRSGRGSGKGRLIVDPKFFKNRCSA